jgi:hypothetical protein
VSNFVNWLRKHRLNVVLCVLLLLVGSAAARIRMGEREEYRLRRQTEALVAEKAGVIVGLETDNRGLRERASVLEEEIERLRETVPKVEIREVVKWKVREVEIPVPFEKTVMKCPDGTELECPDCPQPILDFEGASARLDSERGNIFAVGSVDVWRTYPEPRELVGSFPWRQDDVELFVKLPPQPKGWGVGASAGFLNGQLVYGPAVALPQWKPRIFRWQPEIETTASAVAGGGEWAVVTTAVVRF